MLSELDICERLVVAMLVAIVFGINRNLHHRAAGVRTLALVALMTCGLVMGIINYAQNEFAALTRTIQGIVSGIGFIGAGVILHRQASTNVLGLTTAAMVWFVAGLGILAGLGQLLLVVCISGFGGLALLIGRPLEKWIYLKVRGTAASPVHPPEH